MTLTLCERLEVDIRITSKFIDKRVDRIVFVEKLVIISARSIVSILIKIKDIHLSERDYLFQSISRGLNLESFDEVMTHIVSAHVAAVQICNFTEKPVIIPRRARLDRIIEYEEHECYVTDSIETSLAADSSWKKPLTQTI